MNFNPMEHQHRRLNPLTGQWVLVCPHRMLRPWSGQEECPEKNELLVFDPNNPLCPGVTRANGVVNPFYESTFVFTNDFPALLEDTPSPPKNEDPLFQAAPANGTCRVMCFHPSSDLSLPLMVHSSIENVIHEWIKQYNELSQKYTWVQIFENKGSTMGCSNPHPHCQIWACSFLPSEPALKDENLQKYFKQYNRALLDDYLMKEIERNQRIVILNPDWIVIVPYWAAWPFETMIISRNKNKRINDLTRKQISSLAQVLKQLTTKYDNLFKCSFPYSMGFHGAPSGDMTSNDDKHWTLHAIYYPPLLRSAKVRKFMVGFELLCQAQRDLTPEQAAQRLKDVDGNKHYLH